MRRLVDEASARLLAARRECAEFEARRRRAAELLVGIEEGARAAGSRWASADRELSEAIEAELRENEASEEVSL